MCFWDYTSEEGITATGNSMADGAMKCECGWNDAQKWEKPVFSTLAPGLDGRYWRPVSLRERVSGSQGFELGMR